MKVQISDEDVSLMAEMTKVHEHIQSTENTADNDGKRDKVDSDEKFLVFWFHTWEVNDSGCSNGGLIKNLNKSINPDLYLEEFFDFRNEEIS